MALQRNQTTRQRNQTGQQMSGQSGQQQQYEQYPRAAGTAFPTPILSRDKQTGELINVIAFGDIPGHSPSLLCVDVAGDFTWLGLNEVRATDSRVLPLTPELLSQMQNTQNQQQTEQGLR